MRVASVFCSRFLLDCLSLVASLLAFNSILPQFILNLAHFVPILQSKKGSCLPNKLGPKWVNALLVWDGTDLTIELDSSSGIVGLPPLVPIPSWGCTVAPAGAGEVENR